VAIFCFSDIVGYNAVQEYRMNSYLRKRIRHVRMKTSGVDYKCSK